MNINRHVCVYIYTVYSNQHILYTYNIIEYLDVLDWLLEFHMRAHHRFPALFAWAPVARIPRWEDGKDAFVKRTGSTSCPGAPHFIKSERLAVETVTDVEREVCNSWFEKIISNMDKSGCLGISELVNRARNTFVQVFGEKPLQKKHRHGIASPKVGFAPSPAAYNPYASFFFIFISHFFFLKLSSYFSSTMLCKVPMKLGRRSNKYVRLFWSP